MTVLNNAEKSSLDYWLVTFFNNGKSDKSQFEKLKIATRFFSGPFIK